MSDAHMVWIRVFMRLKAAYKSGYRPVFLHTVKTSHLNLAAQCVSVWSVGLWHDADQLRRGDACTCMCWASRSLSRSSAGCRTLPAASCTARSGFVFFLCVWCLRFCSCCLFSLRSPRAVKWQREEHPEVFMKRNNKSGLFRGLVTEYPLLSFWEWSAVSPACRGC